MTFKKNIQLSKRLFIVSMSVHVVTEQHGTSITGKGLVQDGMRDIVGVGVLLAADSQSTIRLGIGPPFETLDQILSSSSFFV
jgi:hypothetical protein